MTAQTCLTLESRPTQADHLVEAKITWAGFDLQHRHGVVRPFSPRDSVGSQGVRHCQSDQITVARIAAAPEWKLWYDGGGERALA